MYNDLLKNCVNANSGSYTYTAEMRLNHTMLSISNNPTFDEKKMREFGRSLISEVSLKLYLRHDLKRGDLGFI